MSQPPKSAESTVEISFWPTLSPETFFLGANLDSRCVGSILRLPKNTLGPTEYPWQPRLKRSQPPKSAEITVEISFRPTLSPETFFSGLKFRLPVCWQHCRVALEHFRTDGVPVAPETKKVSASKVGQDHDGDKLSADIQP